MKTIIDSNVTKAQIDYIKANIYTSFKEEEVQISSIAQKESDRWEIKISTIRNWLVGDILNFLDRSRLAMRYE